MATVFCKKCTKIWHLNKKLLPKICSKISAETLLKKNSISCAIYCMLTYFVHCENCLVKLTPGVIFFGVKLLTLFVSPFVTVKVLFTLPKVSSIQISVSEFAIIFIGLATVGTNLGLLIIMLF